MSEIEEAEAAIDALAGNRWWFTCDAQVGRVPMIAIYNKEEMLWDGFVNTEYKVLIQEHLAPKALDGVGDVDVAMKKTIDSDGLNVEVTIFHEDGRSTRVPQWRLI